MSLASERSDRLGAASSLGAFHVTHRVLVVNRERLRISSYIDGRLRWSALVAGRQGEHAGTAGEVLDSRAVQDRRSAVGVPGLCLWHVGLLDAD